MENGNLIENSEKQEMVFRTDEEAIEISSFLASTAKSAAKNFPSSMAKDPRKICSTRTHLAKDESFEDYVILDCVFGIPLFDEKLNKTICQRILQNNLLNAESLNNVKFAVHTIVNATKMFIKEYHDEYYIDTFTGTKSTDIIPHPTNSIHFDPRNKKCAATL